MTPGELELLEAGADAKGLTFSAFLVGVGLRAARRAINEASKEEGGEG